MEAFSHNKVEALRHRLNVAEAFKRDLFQAQTRALILLQRKWQPIKPSLLLDPLGSFFTTLLPDLCHVRSSCPTSISLAFHPVSLKPDHDFLILLLFSPFLFSPPFLHSQEPHRLLRTRCIGPFDQLVTALMCGRYFLGLALCPNISFHKGKLGVLVSILYD